jgi:hypothetical protein
MKVVSEKQTQEQKPPKTWRSWVDIIARCPHPPWQGCDCRSRMDGERRIGPRADSESGKPGISGFAVLETQQQLVSQGPILGVSCSSLI